MKIADGANINVLVERTRAFVARNILPYEQDARWTEHGPTEELRRELNGLAREAGLFGPHIPTEFGGLGLDARECAVVFEAAGYSILGPVALHCAAPDEGNTHLLYIVATPAQRETAVVPIARSTTISCPPQPSRPCARKGNSVWR